MSARGRAARRDSTEKAIVKALRSVGADVTLISGPGAPDLLIRHRSIPVPYAIGVEVKSGKGTRTHAQVKTDWPIVRSVVEALSLIGIYYSSDEKARACPCAFNESDPF